MIDSLPSPEAQLQMRGQIIEIASELSLPSEHWVMFGGAVLQLHGIRFANDIDILISSDLHSFIARNTSISSGKRGYEKFSDNFVKRIKSTVPLLHPKSTGHEYRGYLQVYMTTGINDGAYPYNFNDANLEKQTIEDIPCVPLNRIYEWKDRLATRNHATKHTEDLDLIKAHLEQS